MTSAVPTPPPRAIRRSERVVKRQLAPPPPEATREEGGGRQDGEGGGMDGEQELLGWESDVCGICGRPPSDARLLPCLHFFCARCLHDYVGAQLSQNGVDKQGSRSTSTVDYTSGYMHCDKQSQEERRYENSPDDINRPLPPLGHELNDLLAAGKTGTTRTSTVSLASTIYEDIGSPGPTSKMVNNVLGGEQYLDMTGGASTIYEVPVVSQQALHKQQQQQQQQQQQKVKDESQTEVKQRRPLVCPTCTQPLVLGKQGVDSLPHFPLHLTLTSAEHVQSHTAIKTTCDNCDSRSATSRCVDCGHSLCAGCRKAHTWLMTSRHHKVVTLRRDSTPDADKVAENENQVTLSTERCHNCDTANDVTVYCANCDCLACKKCSVTSHMGHSTGDRQALVTRYGQMMERLVEQLDIRLTERSDTVTVLRERVEQGAAEKVKVVAEVERQRAVLHQLVDDCCSRLLAALDDAMEGVARQQQRDIDKVKVDEAQMKHCLWFVDRLKSSSQYRNDVTLTHSALRQLHVLLSRPDPAPSHYTDINFQTATPTVKDIAPHLGKLLSVATPAPPAYPLPPIPTTIQPLKMVSRFDAKGLTETKGCEPTGMALLANGDIALVDDINKKVKIFTTGGLLKFEIAPKGNNRLIDPWDVALTANGHFAITDRGSREVKVLTLSSQCVLRFGSHLGSAWGVAVVPGSGDIVVTDTVKRTVWVHDCEGRVRCSLQDVNPHYPGLFAYPEYVAVSNNGDIVVSDFERHCVFIFDRVGHLLQRVGGHGQSASEFSVPCGLAIDNQGNILVCDYNNQRVVALTPQGQSMGTLLGRQQGVMAPQTLLISHIGQVLLADRKAIKIFSNPHIDQQVAEIQARRAEGVQAGVQRAAARSTRQPSAVATNGVVMSTASQESTSDSKRPASIPAGQQQIASNKVTTTQVARQMVTPATMVTASRVTTSQPAAGPYAATPVTSSKPVTSPPSGGSSEDTVGPYAAVPISWITQEMPPLTAPPLPANAPPTASSQPVAVHSVQTTAQPRLLQPRVATNIPPPVPSNSSVVARQPVPGPVAWPSVGPMPWPSVPVAPVSWLPSSAPGLLLPEGRPTVVGRKSSVPLLSNLIPFLSPSARQAFKDMPRKTALVLYPNTNPVPPVLDLAQPVTVITNPADFLPPDEIVPGSKNPSRTGRYTVTPEGQGHEQGNGGDEETDSSSDSDESNGESSKERILSTSEPNLCTIQHSRSASDLDDDFDIVSLSSEPGNTTLVRSLSIDDVTTAARKRETSV